MKNRDVPYKLQNVTSLFGPYFTDFLIFTAILILIYGKLFKRLYAPFFTHESTLGLMQFTFYMKALHSGGTPFWDSYVSLAQAHVPISPIFSPVTLILVSIAWVFNVSDIETLATMFAAANYVTQLLMGYFMYLFLRALSVGRLAAIIGGIGYSYNCFTQFFGMNQGYWHTTPLMFAPLVFIFFSRLFSKGENTFLNIIVSGILLGLCFVSNGDIKPSIAFVPVLIIFAIFEGRRNYSPSRLALLIAAVLGITAAVAAPQIYPTYETLKEASTAHFPVLADNPLDSANTLLGFSQNTFSALIGFLFPLSYFDFYNYNPKIGIAGIHYWEMKFSFGFALFFLSCLGLFYKTRLHRIWYLTLIMFALYILGSNTPLWPVFGFLSKIFSIRYPTRSAIIIYFLLSIYAAYGVEVLLDRSSILYKEWFRRSIGYVLVFAMIIAAGLFIVWLQDRYELFQPFADLEQYMLAVSALFFLIAGAIPLFYFFMPDRAEDSVKYAVPLLLILFSVAMGLFIFSGYFIYNDLNLHDPMFRPWRAGLKNLIESFAIIFTLEEPRLYREFINILAAITVGLALILLGRGLQDMHRRNLFISILVLAMAALYLSTGYTSLKIPESLLDDPSLVLRRDPEIIPIYNDTDYRNYRINLADINRLAPELGFKKSINNYCCRQFEDDLHLSFGMIHGPQVYENIKNLVRGNYNHPFYKIYSVRYFVDYFRERPWSVPNDPSFKLIADTVLMMGDAKPMVYFMDKYEIMERQAFVDNIVAPANPSILERVYLHDAPEKVISQDTEPVEADIKVISVASGKMRIKVTVNKPGFLVFSEIWAPSWRVYVNGIEKRDLKAYGMLQAVQLEKGDSDVLFEFNVFHSWQMKLAVAGCLLVFALLLLAVIRKIRLK